MVKSSPSIHSSSHHSTSITHHPSSITHHPSSIIHHPSSITHHPSSIIHHPSSIIHHPSPIIHHPAPIISHPSSCTHHLTKFLYLGECKRRLKIAYSSILGDSIRFLNKLGTILIEKTYHKYNLIQIIILYLCNIKKI
jgi:hypothetical protein